MQSLQALALPALFIAFASPANPDVAFRAGDFGSAKQGFLQRIAADPKDVPALVGLATIESYENKLAEAERDARRALSVDPSNQAAQRVIRTIDLRAGNSSKFRIDQSRAAILPFLGDSPLPVVRLDIDGVATNVVIDTGAPTLVVSEEFASAHNLVLHDAGQGVFAGGRGAPIRRTAIASVSADGLIVRDVTADVMPLPQLSSSPRVDAVLGTGFLTHFIATLDYPRRRLVLDPKNRAPRSSDAPAGIPMWLVGDHFIFAKASINRGDEALFNVDSGGSGIGVQLTKAALDAAHITPDADRPTTGMSPAGPVRSLPFVADSVALGAALQSNVPGVYLPSGDQYGIFPFDVAGTISQEFLKHYAVTFDFTAMRLALR